MDGYIYVNYAYESREAAAVFLKRLSGAGLELVHGKVSEERLVGARLVIHLMTVHSRSSRSYRHMKNLAARYELPSVQFSLDGERAGEEADLLLTVALAAFKNAYAGAVPETEKGQDQAPAAPEELKEQDQTPAGPEGDGADARPLEEQPDETEPALLAEEEPEEGPADDAAGESLSADERENMFREGMNLLGGEEGASVSSAIALIMKAANQGYAPAQYQLSVCYDEGLGVPKSMQEAARWREMAAYGGLVRAQGEMGYCYEWGQGVTRNIREAVKWYQLASEQGDAQSKNNLAYCYQKGRGVSRDMVQAIRLYTEAAQAGDASAQYNLAYCYWYGEGVTINKDRAIELFKDSMAGGNAKAAQMMRVLGRVWNA